MNRKQRIIAELESWNRLEGDMNHRIPIGDAISIVERIMSEPPSQEEINEAGNAIFKDGRHVTPSSDSHLLVKAALSAFMGESEGRE